MFFTEVIGKCRARGFIKIYIIYNKLCNQCSKSLATPNAAAAAKAPISVTFTAPHKGLTPVILLLKYPKTNKQIKVATTDIFSASVELEIKK